MKKFLLFILLGLIFLLVCFQIIQDRHPLTPSVNQTTTLLPRFKIDPFWPKPLPKNWLLGQVASIAIDSHDHIWIIQRPSSVIDLDGNTNPPIADCCTPAPAVMEFDQDGNYIQGWGGPGVGYDWPSIEHGIFVDDYDNVWIGGADVKDNQVLKFTWDGKFLMQIGKPGQSTGDTDTKNLNRPANMYVDVQQSEVYVADGYGNRRVIVFDSQTGAFKRLWGANGLLPGDPSVKQFGSPVHSVRLSRDETLYVCDRVNDRIQIFQKDGTFVKELTLDTNTLGNGSCWDVDFSTDENQQFLFVADGENEHIWILSRESGEVLDKIGRGGRYAGQFLWLHSLKVDSKGNIYTGEVGDGQRLQKFNFEGILPPNAHRWKVSQP